MINPTTLEGGPASDTARESAPPTAATGSGGSNFRIRGDVILAATADLPARQRDALRWVAGFCREKNIHHREVAAKLRQPNGDAYSPDSLYHALTGGRKSEQLDNIVTAIERFRKLEDEREESLSAGFIETAVSRAIWRLCRRALRRRRVGFIFGDSQIGKTVGLETYAKAHNHGETHYFRMPVGCDFTYILGMMARSLGVPIFTTLPALRDAIVDAVDDHMLLVFDEMHEVFGNDGRNKLGLKLVNFLREIFDRKKCGLVLCGTAVFHDALFGTFARNLVQTWRRALPPLYLPKSLGNADLAKFARAFKLDPAEDREIAIRILRMDEDKGEITETIQENPLKFQTQINANHGLGRWVTILEEAADLAKEKRRPMSWGLVIHAWESLKAEDFTEEAA